MNDLEPARIREVKFGLMASADMLRLATIECRDPFMRWTRDHVLHNELGTDNTNEECATCQKNVYECPGHYGVIRLELPVFHVGFLLQILRILRCICKSCGRVLLSNPRIDEFTLRYKNPKGLTFSQKKALFNKVFTEASRVYICPHCQAINGKVSRAKNGILRISHQPSAKHLKQLPKKGKQCGQNRFEEDLRSPSLNVLSQDLTPDVVHGLFRRIPSKDLIVLDMDPSSSPESMVLTHIHVPPRVVRPSPPPLSTGAIRHDDLTILMNEVLVGCNEIRKHRVRGGTTQKYYELWESLQMSVARLLDDQLPNYPRSIRDKHSSQLSSYVGRLKGKEGRFRNTLSGKRVNFSGRSVISPDPNLSIHEVALPLQMAQKLTFPERVNEQNIQFCRNLVCRGPDVYPGANFWLSASSREKIHLKSNYENRYSVAQKLQVGDVIERHVVNGDALIFNRQPSLHRLSMMCHTARVLPYRTLRFNECVCQPYNADFDGDEMNIHVPQTVEARAEALTLMSATQNIFSARNGCPIIAPLQDFLTGVYLITARDMFFSRAELAQLIAYFSPGFEFPLPAPSVIRPIELWSGKQLFQSLVESAMSSSKLRESLSLNFSLRSKATASKEEVLTGTKDEHVLFFNSELLSGRLDKCIMGSGERAKNGFFYHVKKVVGLDCASECMGRLSRLTSRFLMEHGFSIGIDDVAPDDELHEASRAVVRKGFEKAEKCIRIYNDGKLHRLSGCTVEETLEKEIKRVLNEVRDDCGRLCIESLPESNAPLIMAKCGSKGSMLNISQMVVCVGQQIVNDRRIDDHFSHRSIPHFPKNCHDPEARGFVQNSFYSGLTPLEFVFHTMAGREGLVQSAIKTSQTGYLGRRIMKVLEDLTVQYDYTVRNADGCVVQLRYGEDSLDPLKASQSSLPQDIQAAWNRLTSIQHDSTKNSTGIDLQSLLHSVKAFQESPSCVLPMKTIHYITEVCSSDFLHGKKAFVSNVAFQAFLETVNRRYCSNICEPGSPCGVIAAQSLSEPTTQMTLRTFHFAGVSGMSVTQGVPRIEEIMDARRTISTPFVTLSLREPHSLAAAKRMQATIERTYLHEVTKSITQKITEKRHVLEVKLCPQLLRQRNIVIDSKSVIARITKALKKLSQYARDIGMPEAHTIVLQIAPFADVADFDEVFDQLIATVKSTVIVGLPTCPHALIRNTVDDSVEACYEIIVNTDDFKNLIVLDGVRPHLSKCNHVASIESTLGIEAARRTIIDEILAVMQVYALTVDIRHVMLLADAMTARGVVLGTTNSGLSKDRDSVLKLASFERTQEHLYNAASHARGDKHLGISESIMLGLPAKIGTNLFGLLDARDRLDRNSVPKDTTLGDFWEKLRCQVR